MKTKEKSKSRKYNPIGSLLWALRNMWEIDWRFPLSFFLFIPISIGGKIAGDFFPKVLIDSLETGRVFSEIAMLIVLYMTVLCVLQNLTHFLSSRQNARRYSVSDVYQLRMCHKDDITDCENHERQYYQKSRNYAQRDTCSGNCAAEFFWEDIVSFLQSVLGITAYASLMTVIHPLLFVIILTVSLLSYIPARWQTAYTEKHKDKWEKEGRRRGYLEGLSEDFDKAKDIKLYDMTGWIEKMIGDYQAYQIMWDKRCSLRGLWASVFSAVLTFLQNGAAYLFLILALLDGTISVGDFVFFFGAVASISGYIRGLAGQVAALASRADKIGYYRDFFAIEEKFNHGKGCPLPPAGSPVTIELRDVWYRYDGAADYTLKGINLTISAGEKLALVGMNGAGKTTLIKLICGFYMPTKGEILVNGQPIPAYNIEEYYSLIAAVFQDISIPAMTILHFITSCDDEMDRDNSETADRTRAEAALRQSGLWEKIESLPKGMDTYLKKGIFDDAIDLSGGEAQKLLLARAIYKGGSLLVLDEPTAALDPIAENRLYLQYHALTENKTSIYISHRFASTRFCDRIILLEDGKITESGSHEELMEKNGQYAYMFDVQAKYYQEGKIDA
ncbi:MAG: ABC transporter ATP-binding protein [Clostridia bacterium]|nr:ABC transporter ATP-binding protein [Clostridia bacterium]